MSTNRYRTVAGVAIVAVGVLFSLGFTTAEAFYPGYSTSAKTISALGSDSGTATSRLVFNGVMVAAGLLMVVAAYALRRVYESATIPATVAVTGVVGFAGVGLFPAQTGASHTIAALVSFGGTGILALLAARYTTGPYRYVSAALGILELLALVAFVALGGNTALGVGGLERYVAYLGVVWAPTYGGYLLATVEKRRHGG